MISVVYVQCALAFGAGFAMAWGLEQGDDGAVILTMLLCVASFVLGMVSY